jgi:hypothetical protein
VAIDPSDMISAPSKSRMSESANAAPPIPPNAASQPQQQQQHVNPESPRPSAFAPFSAMRMSAGAPYPGGGSYLPPSYLGGDSTPVLARSSVPAAVRGRTEPSARMAYSYPGLHPALLPAFRGARILLEAS